MATALFSDITPFKLLLLDFNDYPWGAQILWLRINERFQGW
jgi:hypothetical protein